MYHSLVYDFKVGPTNIYVLAMPMPNSLGMGLASASIYRQ